MTEPTGSQSNVYEPADVAHCRTPGWVRTFLGIERMKVLAVYRPKLYDDKHSKTPIKLVYEPYNGILAHLSIEEAKDLIVSLKEQIGQARSGG